MFFLEVVLFGLLLIGGVYVQHKYIESDKISLVMFPIGLGLITLLGIIIHGVISFFDNNSTYYLGKFLSNFFKTFILFFTFAIKTALAPIVTSITMIMFFFIIYLNIRNLEYGTS